ncbi:MAG TPA: DUF4383 domain-containing protein [Actinophytocola sp.]|uniref:DUF4383 domain-containing protein n=1 Tax=Actinophytocola sp. TaxID=1872138 RepID=UPI002F949805
MTSANRQERAEGTVVSRGPAHHRGRLVVVALGVLYLVLAAVGLATVGWHDFGYEEPVRMFGFLGVSTLLCVVHALLGVVLTTAGLRRAATAIAPVLVVAFVAMAVFGAVAKIFGGSGDPLNFNWWNVVLYLVSAAACVYVYVTAWRGGDR